MFCAMIFDVFEVLRLYKMNIFCWIGGKLGNVDIMLGYPNLSINFLE